MGHEWYDTWILRKRSSEQLGPKMVERFKSTIYALDWVKASTIGEEPLRINQLNRPHLAALRELYFSLALEDPVPIEINR